MKPARTINQTPHYANTGYGPEFAVVEIGLPDRVAVIEPETAFWALVPRDALPEALAGPLVSDFLKRAESMQDEMHSLRFGLRPSAVYFNPTERCNLNCSYCYLPEEMRKNGRTMTAEEVVEALRLLLAFFRETLPGNVKPQLIFHGSEPLLARDAVFAGIERFSEEFHFGIQSNATLLDDGAIQFLKDHGVGVGISLDAHQAEIADATRKNWHGTGAFDKVLKVMEKLASYPAFNVITTVTQANVGILPALVEFYHERGVQTIMLNPVRCTQLGGQAVKPADDELSEYFTTALDRAYSLYEKSGRKVVIANFANVLAGVIGPTGRRLMCDISPCGGGRCFFAVSALGDVFPCSEFIGFPEFNGGNLFRDSLPAVLESSPFLAVTERKVEQIVPCRKCAIRHFCGAPCPAEVKSVSGTMDAASPYCAFYEEQVRYAFRVVAEGREEAYLWDGWQDETEEVFCWV